MSAIPFSLIGILPAHGALGAFFTATSIIGFIAGAGLVVRNSIILVDFIEQRLREGIHLQQAVVDAGAIRFRPMVLTAAAVVVGACVILLPHIVKESHNCNEGRPTCSADLTLSFSQFWCLPLRLDASIRPKSDCQTRAPVNGVKRARRKAMTSYPTAMIPVKDRAARDPIPHQ
jgi:hypothetical protein